MTEIYLIPPFQSITCIQTNCASLIEQLHTKYGQYISSNSAFPVNYRIKIVKEATSYYLEFGGSILTTEAPLIEVENILFDNTRYDPKIFALHGAAVEWKNKAYLLLASTMSGKSTLTSYLTYNGRGYITDDCILLDRETFQIYPYTTPIQLRDGGMEILQKYHALPEKGLIKNDDLQRYIYTPSCSITKSLPLGGIFFIRRSDTENQVIPMDTNTRITSLMKAPITVYPITTDYLQFLMRLAKIECSYLIYSDMAYVMEVIQHQK